MTAAAESQAPLRAARGELEHFDNCRDLYSRRRRIQLLAGSGVGDQEVARMTGVSAKNVGYHKNQPPPPQRPRLYDGAGVSDKRADELESRAELTLRLSAILREEDPTIVWGALCRLTHRQLQELAMIALAAIPIDATRRELLGWVENLTTTRGEL